MILYFVSVWLYFEEYTHRFLVFIVDYFNLKSVYLTAFIVHCSISDNISSSVLSLTFSYWAGYLNFSSFMKNILFEQKKINCEINRILQKVKQIMLAVLKM